MDIIILKIKNLTGNCELNEHKGEIILSSFQHAVSIPMQMDRSNTERTAGRPSFTEMTFSKSSDISSPALYSACAAGSKLGDATIYVGRTEGSKFMSLIEYVLSDAMVSAMSTSGGGGQPTDSFSLSYTAISMVYSQQNKDSTKKGSAGFGWDLVQNIPATPK